jgi:hypothetical protein
MCLHSRQQSTRLRLDGRCMIDVLPLRPPPTRSGRAARGRRRNEERINDRSIYYKKENVGLVDGGA